MAGQDIKKRLQPGQSQPVNVGGDFIFLKFADRPVSILINGGDSSGSRVTMEPGDKYRPGGFDSFEVENTDTDRPAQIIMTVGRGDYNRQIVKGEITVAPGIQASDGTWKADQRQTVSGFMVPQYPKQGAQALENGQILATKTKEQVWIPVDSEYRTTEKILGAWIENNKLKQLMLVDMSSGEALYVRETDENISQIDDKLITYIEPNDWQYKAGVLINGEVILAVENSTANDGMTYFATIRGLAGTYDSIETFFQVSKPENAGSNHVNTATVKDGMIVWSMVGANLNGELLWFMQPETKAITKKINKAEMADVQSWPYAEWGFTFDIINKQWLVTSVRTAHCWIYNEDFTKLINIYTEYFQGTDNGIVGKPTVIKVGNYLYGNFQEAYYDNEAKINKYIIEAEKQPFTGKIWATGCYSPFVRRDRSQRATLAEIEITEAEGLTTISGEVIRVMLEWYMGAVIKDDAEYMDHVYSVKITGQNGEVMQVQTQANGATLAALGIEDKFTATFPAQIEMTVDNNIETITRLGV